MNTHEARLVALRQQLKHQNLDGFVVPICDEHMSEYVGAYAQRLAWLTGFGGSAGTAVVLADSAAMFVDGRYTLQVRDQVDARFYSYEQVPAVSIAGWLAMHAPADARIGYDPWLHTRGWADAVGRALAHRGGVLVAVDSNPVDTIWQGRPAPSAAPAVPHALEHAGIGADAKRAGVARWLADNGCDAVVIAALDSVAWLFNMRGSDIDCTPVALAYALVHADGTADLFIAPEKVTPELVAHLGAGVRIAPREGFVASLEGLTDKRVGVDPERSVAAVFQALERGGATIAALTDPVLVPKAVKNPVEIAGQRAAQARDGAALARFLHWLDRVGPQGEQTELTASARLEGERRATNALIDLSFGTISGAGPNGAIVHYSASEATCRRLEPNSMYLVDSGGQYRDGTTDVTRTVWIGPDAPPADVRDRFTRVLKGHIALARAVFPAGTNGAQLDVLARQFLWAAGLDYAHGTGHGVGSFLSVHEGPQRIAKAQGGQAGTAHALLPGMIVSNEPGYYRAGAYGIRIENLVLVEPRDIAGAEGEFLGFATLTHAPIDRRLIDTALLDAAERGWIDRYHADVRSLLAPQLDVADRTWLNAATAPL
ncbi:aminopeptidase P family protein [Novosphingobium sp.]|uniref:aminopeptidase P family protein n=1 Tax=Novosphingobium sp. TaxID=1874826 RepID=UPI003341A0CB